MDFNRRLKDDANRIEACLESIANEQMRLCPSKRVIEAESYSLLAGGKHIRAILCLEFYKLFGGKNNVDQIASCLELVHTFSLIHDDMPEMDNDDLRRGKPSCHIAFDNATALLAGDGLAILPYEIISSMAKDNMISCEVAVKLINLLATSSGNSGMISGQMMDLLGEKQPLDREQIARMYKCKTGALIKCSCLFGAVLANADEDMLTDAAVYADNVGLAFQLVDDLLDVTSTNDVLGKPVGSDASKHKNTLLNFVGSETASRIINDATENAVAAIKKYGNSDFLVWLAYELSTRKK